MRLPWGTLDWFIARCRNVGPLAVLGCLSFEKRSIEVPRKLCHAKLNCGEPQLLQIQDPPDAFPDYSADIKARVEENWAALLDARIKASRTDCDLLASEDQLLELLRHFSEQRAADVVVLDISSFPKRYFCFFLKRLLQDERVRSIVVTYTQPGQRGYSADHLSDDPMPCDFLPGYIAGVPGTSEWLVVSVGFEVLDISSLIRPYRETARKVKFLLTFPPSVHTNQRQWNTLLEIARATGPENLTAQDVGIVSLWDAEGVFSRLEKWTEEWAALLSVRGRRIIDPFRSISLAPFGPKTHSLGMALFAIKHRCGMYYTQPKAYNPNYSVGIGESWCYVVKWDGVICFDRQAVHP